LDKNLEQYVRCAAMGLQLPYEWCWDSSALSGANTRLITAKAARTFEKRTNLLVAQGLSRIWRYAAAVAINNGDLPMTNNWNNISWTGPRSITVDHGRDAQSDIALVEAGMMSLREYYSSYSQDWEEELDQIKQERETYGPIGPTIPLTPLPARPSAENVGMPQA
jgi:capsid protein